MNYKCNLDISKFLFSDFSLVGTGKYLSEALILAATNPQYDTRLFFELTVQYMKTTSSEHDVYTNCFLFLSYNLRIPSDFPEFIHISGLELGF